MNNIKSRIFEGVGTAIVTPFSRGKVDYNSLKRIIEFQISEGVNAIVVCGTTGESATLDDSEKRKIIEFTVNVSNKRAPVIAGTGCNNIRKATELSAFAGKCGADAVLTVTPYYNKASKNGLIQSFTTIADAAKIPVLLYNVPSRTGIDIPFDVYEELSKHENIYGVKEAGGSISVSEKILNICGENFSVYAGNDELTVPTMSIGGSGVISVVSNVIPSRMKNMCKLALDGKTNEAGREQRAILKLIEALFSEVNPIPVKTAMKEMGLCSDEMRLPLCALDSVKTETLKSILKEYKLV